MPKNVFRKRIFGLTLALSVSVTGFLNASKAELEAEVVKGLLKRAGTSIAGISRDAVTSYQPFVEVCDAIKKEEKKPVIPRSAASYFSTYIVDPEVVQAHWVEAEGKVDHPLLKAVCVFQRYKSCRIQDSVMHLHEDLLDLIFMASNVDDKQSHFKLRIMAARQAEQIDDIVERMGFEFKDKPGFILLLSKLIRRSAELWRSIAEDESVYALDAHTLYKLFPKGDVNGNPRLIEELGFESIDQNTTRKDWPPAYFSLEEKNSEHIRMKEHLGFLKAAFKAMCLCRASGFDAWNYRYMTRSRLGQYGVASVLPDLKRMLKTYKATAKAIDKMVELMPGDIRTPVLLLPGAGGWWQQFCKFRLTALAAELRSIPSVVLESKGLFSTRPYLNQDELTLLQEATEDMEPVLKRTHKKVIGFIGADELGWCPRLVLVRSIHALAMFEADSAEKLKKLKEAYELSKLRKDEHDPTSYMLTDKNRGQHRYPLSDLQSNNGDFLTWEAALEFKIKQLEKPEEK